VLVFPVMKEEAQYQLEARLRINLAGLSGTLHRRLQGLMNFVALGLKAAEAYTDESLSLPDVEFPLKLSNAAEVRDPERVRREFKQWILAAGVRDAVEAFSMVLESAREILAAWSISLVGEKVPIKLFNSRLVDEGLEFHRKGFPGKLAFLRDNYSVNLPSTKEGYLLSINRARNCLVHRGGTVSFQDLDAKPSEIDAAISAHRSASPTEPWTNAQVRAALSTAGIEPSLEVKWLRLRLFVERADERIYLDVREGPHDVGGGVLGVEVQLAERRFGLGEPVVFDSNEFSEIAWTLSTCARNLTEAVEQRGRELGVPFDEATTQEETPNTGPQPAGTATAAPHG
jgi:hypothetical protein